MNFKKLMAVIVTASMMFVMFTGCKSGDSGSGGTETGTGTGTTATTNPNGGITTPTTGDKIKVVTTIFPQYDWVREIVGEKSELFELSLLIDSSVDMHSYNPTVGDIGKISAADLFIYIGGESDEWVEDVLSQANNKDMVAVNLIEELGDAVLMSGHDDHDEDHEGEGEHEDEEEHEGEDDHDDHDDEEDEHIWMSLHNAEILCEAIAEAIISLDSGNADIYNANLNAYIEKLEELDGKYRAMAEAAAGDTVVFADRFPFLYLMNDYGIEHYAAFSGCSAESEASFSTIAALAEAIDELDLKFVMLTETGDSTLAETVINSTKAKNQKILVLDGFKAVTSSDIQKGTTYLSVMESNLEVLREALS